MDRPDGRRKIHAAPVPRLGGVAIFAAFVLSSGLLLVLERTSSWYDSALAGAYIHLVIACAAVMFGCAPKAPVAQADVSAATLVDVR